MSRALIVGRGYRQQNCNGGERTKPLRRKMLFVDLEIMDVEKVVVTECLLFKIKLRQRLELGDRDLYSPAK